jgi:hypothetical protein
MRSSSSAVALVRARPGIRTLAWLLLALLLVQAGAQWCAAHCGISAFVGPAADVSVSVADGRLHAGGDALAASASAAMSPMAADERPAATEAPCPLVAWCELGHASMLPAADAADAPSLTSVPIRSPEAGPVLFLNMPEDRPPTA